MERREFIKKTGAGVIAAGFPGIISAQTVTNAMKVGLVGAGGRGSGAAAQALSADANAELTAVADIDEAIVERASQRLKGSEKFGARVKIDKAFFGLDAYDKVINSGVDVVLLATPPGFRPQHLAAAVERQQARLLREAVRHRFAGRARGDGGAEAGADEESLARRRLLLALQQHDPGGVPAGGERRDRPAGGVLRRPTTPIR